MLLQTLLSNARTMMELIRGFATVYRHELKRGVLSQIEALFRAAPAENRYRLLPSHVMPSLLYVLRETKVDL
jgi:hypothetical protein